MGDSENHHVGTSHSLCSPFPFQWNKRGDLVSHSRGGDKKLEKHLIEDAPCHVQLRYNKHVNSSLQIQF